MKGLGLTVALVLVILFGGLTANFVWQSVSTPVRGSVAVSQIEDSNQAYAIQKRVAQDDIVSRAIGFVTGSGIVIVVLSFLYVNREKW